MTATQHLTPNGTFAPTGSAASTLCPAGQYNFEPGQPTCLSCPAGFFCGTEGTISPAECPIGEFCPQGSVEPQPCPAGSFGNRTHLHDQASCTPCEPGHYCASTGLVGPTGLCLAGYYCVSGASSNAPTVLTCTGIATTIQATCVSTVDDDQPGDADFDACAAVTALDDGTACTAVTTAAEDDGGATACTYTPAETPTCDLDGSTDSTDECPPGCVYSGGSECPAGHWCEEGSSTPSACPVGSYIRGIAGKHGVCSL